MRSLGYSSKRPDIIMLLAWIIWASGCSSSTASVRAREFVPSPMDGAPWTASGMFRRSASAYIGQKHLSPSGLRTPMSALLAGSIALTMPSSR